MAIGVARSVGFGAIASADARILILGTLPGKVSLERHEYYAQPRNTFWRIMGVLLGFRPDLSYEERVAKIAENRLALWDVCAAARRSGSLDSQLSDIELNDFEAFFGNHMRLVLVCFNGGPAAKIYTRSVLPGLPASFQEIQCLVLPSTSPAHTSMTFEEKLMHWRAALVECIGPISRQTEPNSDSESRPTPTGTPPSKVPAPVRSSVKEHEEPYATQRVTAADLSRRQIRIPSRSTSLTRSLFPPSKATVNVQLRGRLVQGAWDPRTGLDRQRSGVLQVSSVLRELVSEDEVLLVSTGEDGTIRID